MAQFVQKQQLNPGNPASYGLLMAISQPMLLFSKHKKLIAINKKARTLLGLISKKITNLALPDLLEKCNHQFALSPKSYSFRHGRKLTFTNINQKTFLRIEFVCMESISESGKTNGYILLGNLKENNTSSLVKGKNTLSKTHNLKFDAIPCGVFVKDTQGQVIDCNITMARMLGLESTSELVDTTNSYELAIKGYEEVKRNDQKVISTKKTHLFEEDVTLKNGKKHCFQTMKSPVLGNNGEVLGIIGTSIDITKKKNSEITLNKKLKALKQESIKSYNYLDRILASIPCSVWWTDKKNVILGGNNRVAQFLGLKSRDELIGLTYEEVGKRKNISRILRKSYEDDMEVMRTGIAKENIPEPPLPGPDGEKIYYVTARTPLMDENGIISGMIGTSWDITNRVVMEKKLKAAQKKIEASSRAKDEFLATVSHELRTPLNGILGMADILSRQELKPVETAMVSDLKKSGAILLSLIDDLLDITKMDLHEIKISRGSLHLEESIKEVINQLSSQSEKKSLDVEFNYSAELPKVIQGDTQRMKQILFNIIGNAIKFTEKGKISIKVKTKESQKPQKMLELSIKDTGIGIPNDKLDFIFDRFTQVRSDSTAHIPGAGLGLSIARSLVKLMGGAILISSRINHGSTFTITLPYEPIYLKESEEEYPLDISHARILVIDDDLSSGETILRDIQPLNLQLVSSNCAIKVIESNDQSNNHFDIVIINAKSIGKQTASLIRQMHEKFRHLKLATILCYETLESNLKAKAKQQGVSIFVPLSDKNIQLTKVIQEAWEKTQQSKQNSKHSVTQLTPHVLLVEDNPINQKIAVHLLSELNCIVDVSPDGTTAIDLFTKNNYDIVLLDVGLPDIDGTLVSKAFKKMKGPHAKIPIIAMTAYASEKDKQRCLNAGMKDVITKPVDLKALRTILNRWLTETIT
jgi:PAS domain S-box-containing protein